VTEPDDAPRRVYLVAGGTPAAEWLSQRLDDPEVQARLRESFEELGRACGLLVEQVARTFAAVVDAYTTALAPAYVNLREQLAAAGVIDCPLPEDPRERALELRRRRNTGPDRQVQHRRPPRRIA
jgi:hypothetical protein